MRIAILLFAVACGKSIPPAEPAQPAPAPPPTQPSEPSAGGDCMKSGCRGTLCVEPGKEVITTCEWKPEYACYQQATCGRQSDGTCGWTQTPELTKCLANPPAQP